MRDDVERELAYARNLATSAGMSILSSCLSRAINLLHEVPKPGQLTRETDTGCFVVTLRDRLDQCIQIAAVAEVSAFRNRAREAAPQIYQHIRAAEAFL